VSEPSLSLLIVDEDPVFRLGLVTALTTIPTLTVIGEVDRLDNLRQQLETALPDVLIIDPQFPRQSRSGWSLLRQLRNTYPTLAIALLTASLEYDQLLAAKHAGIAAYFPKGTAIAELAAGLQQIQQGQTYWPNLQSGQLPAPSLSYWEKSLWRLFRDGLGQIEQSLQQVQRGLQIPNLSDFDRLFWQGRQRELRAARWLVQRLMPAKLRLWQRANRLLTPESNVNSPPSRKLTGPSIANALTLTPPSNLSPLGQILNQLPLQVENLTGIPLELDILQPLKRQELLSLSQQQLQTTLQDLKSLRITPEQLPKNCQSILGEIWRSVTLNFFGKYCQPKSEFTLDQIHDLLEIYQPIIGTEKLEKIPFLVPLFHHLLFDDPLTVNQTIYPANSPEAKQYSELYAQNLIIQVANATMVFILNYFANHEAIKIVLYEQSMLSSRQVARFRNNLAWYYQFSHYWLNPKQIFESQYTLFYLTPQGIVTTQLYASRQQELERLKAVPWLVTILLEFRDALSPRLRSVIEFVGNGLVYVLTQVVGRAIGLIGKGIIQGIGNTWQDSRYGDRRSEQK
jgi:DNA-binding NarL/FixJ family response regulator